MGFLVKVAGGIELRKNRLHEFLVARLRGADKIVVRQVEFFRERLPVRREFIAISLRIFSFGMRGLLDFLAVFVQAGQKKNFLPRLRRERAMTSATIFS